MKNKRKWISKAALTLGVLTMLGSAGAGAVNVAYAAPDPSNPVSDTDTKRTITIWKYEINSSAELGERGNGDPSKAPDLTGKKLMNDVEFEIIKVKAIGNAALTNPLEQKQDVDWEVDTDFTAIKQKTGTDVDGKLVFDVGAGKSADGIYLVRELPSGKDANGKDLYTYTDPVSGETGIKISKPMDPFFVHLPQTKRDETGKLIYDVHVYPKNIVTDTELDKTVEGGKGYSIKAGNSFQWEATTTLPDGLYTLAPRDMTITNYVDPDTPEAAGVDTVFEEGDPIYASYFRVTDEIDKRLLLEDAEVYTITDAGVKAKLIHGTDYKVTLNGAEIASPNKVENLVEDADKKVIVSLTKAGMEKIGVGKLPKLQVVYKVKSNKDFNGTISNQYRIDYLLPGGTPDGGESDEPDYFAGGFDIMKTDEKSNALEKAEFHLADSVENANAKKYLASDGKSYTMDADGKGVSMPDDVTFLLAETDDEGKAEFNGLKLEWFTDTNDNGEQNPEIKEEATWEDKDIKKDYWLVETKSPVGYELIKDPVKVTVTLTSHESLVIDVVNKEKTDLPFTGGAGMTLMIVIALGAITIGTATIVLEKKRRQA